ncbi:hypothetical protein CEF21_10820 [Bacillus sp. FJAT-42376]|nr:hypothetical protein CEF21_10820 [Bacillus sp. FJAT-42376]
MLIAIIIIFSGIMISAHFFFTLQAMDQGGRIAMGLSNPSKCILCTKCGAKNKRQAQAQLCRKCYTAF